MFLNFYTDQKIIQGIERMDKESYKYEGELYKRHANLVKDLAMHKFGISEEDGVELYNDAITAVITKIRTKSYEYKASLNTFIYRILKNRCVSFLEKKRINTVSLDNEDFHLMNQAAAQCEFSTKESIESILLCIKQLSAKCQAIYLLRWRYGFTDEELLEYVNLSSKEVVGVTRRRCEKEFRSLYFS